MTPPGDQRGMVSIGLPVHNGDRFLAEAIQSLLAQTHVALELIISDNGSTDKTESIARLAARRDPRVRYHRSDCNRGAAWNYNNTVHLARGEFFKWAAHDDMHEPSYVTKCVQVLQTDPTISLCYSRAVDIDGTGEPLHVYPPLRYATESTAVDRGKAVLRTLTPCFEVFGVMRRSQLLRTAMIGSYASSDRTLLFELALQGSFHEVPEVLFLHRQHADRSVLKYKSARERDSWFDPARAQFYTLPQWRMVGEHVNAARRAPIGLTQRARSAAAIGPWVAGRARPLARELAGWAVRTSLQRVRQGVMSQPPAA